MKFSLDEVLTPELIDLAESACACSEALEWLREKPRTLNDLRVDWLCFVAANGKTPPAILEALASHPEEEVRWCTARNEWLHPAVLQSMVSDKSGMVRWCLAGNSSTPLDAMRVLSVDEDISVRGMALRNAAIRKLQF